MSEKFRGPGGTVYTTVAKSAVALVGVAALSDGRSRVRVQAKDEETAESLTPYLEGWKQPEGGNPRLSIEVDGVVKTAEAVEAAKRAISALEEDEGDEEDGQPAADNLAAIAAAARSLADRLEALRG